MAKVNQLKNQARREEQRENWSRAIELYTQALDASRKESQGFADLSLYNRIGDIYLRIGQKNTAVRYYEQAIELYAEQDLHTSAIALCNKVLRILPDRSTVFLQLGRLNLATNLVAEGREHYHRYATAMRKRGSEEAALEGLEELISSTGDAGTLTLWARWLAESSDVAAAMARIEKLREALERHGIDPEDVAAQVRSKTVVGFEGKGRGAQAADPLAGAFLTLGDEPSSRSRGRRAPSEPVGRPSRAERQAEATPVEALREEEPAADEEPAAVPAGLDHVEDGMEGSGSEEPPSWEAELGEPLEEDPEAPGAAATPREDETADVDEEPRDPEPIGPGSIPWEQEVEEIIAEFDVGFDDPWTEVDLEATDPVAEAAGHGRERPDPEASVMPAAPWAHASARPPQAVEAAEFDEPETAAGQISFEDAVEVEDEEGLSGAAEEIAADRSVEPEAAESPDSPDSPEDGGRSADAAGERPESAAPPVPAPRRTEAAPEEPPEDIAGLGAEGLEPAFAAGADDLESIVQAAAALGETGGFDAEPAVVADELPEPEAEEPSEADAAPAPFALVEPHVVRPEPPDGEAPEPVEETAIESFEGLVESLAKVDAPDAPEPEGPAVEEDETPTWSQDDSGWADEVRDTLDERARAAAERDQATEDAAEDEVPSARVEEASGAEEPPQAEDDVEHGHGEADLESETIALEWRSAATTPTESAPAPAAKTPRDADHDGRSADNGRPGKRAWRSGSSDDGETRAPLAEPRLKVEEDPEDAFRDWVQSASIGILGRALSELEHRKEHERALAVITRLTELEQPAIDFKIRHVEYLESLGRTGEALELCVVLAGTLESAGRVGEAREAYERARRLAPGDERARQGLTRLEGVEDDSKGEAVHGGPKRPYMPDHVNGTDRRSVIDHPLPTVSLPIEGQGAGPRPYSGVAGGSEAGSDFEQLLSEFRAELHEKPARGDSSSRTELGARLKEMGRLDDAIRELQAAVREPSAPPLAFELLGEAFLEKGQPRIAVRFLEKALGGLSQGDRDILGVLYQLGIAYEALSDPSKALICYERIFSVDIDYRDIQERILSCSA